MIVVDANIVIYLVYETPFTALAREVYARDADWVVPELWEAEVLSGLMRIIRGGYFGLDEAGRIWANAAGILIGKVRKCEPLSVLRTAKEARLTAYDAYYVTLARSLGIILVTEDGAIKENCRDVARSLKAFLGLPEKPSVVREKRAAYRVHRKR